MIPYGRQQVDEADLASVVAVLKSEYLTQGPQGLAFEQGIARYLATPGHAAPFAVACNSATSALHIACMALDAGPGDFVWTCANSFAASSNCGLYCGAQVDFVDIDPLTLNMGVDALKMKLEQASRDKRLPKIVVPVDFTGRSAPLREIRALADEYGFAIVEDASHAIGSDYGGVRVGAHGLADITVFSFHPVKIITTGEGGLAVTNNPDLARRLADLRSHGITRDPEQFEHANEGPWYYEQQALGYNYRLTDVLAALGISQLKRIEGFIAERHRVRDFYTQALNRLVKAGKLILPPQDEAQARSALHLYPVQLGPAAGNTRRQAFDAMRAAGIGVNVHYIPIYFHPYYARLGFQRGLCPNAETYYERAISIPMHAGLTDGDLGHVVASLAAAVC